jgi:hypothetical protein
MELPRIDQKVDLFRDGNLGTNRHADWVAQCRLSGATRKTSAPSEYFAFLTQSVIVNGHRESPRLPKVTPGLAGVASFSTLNAKVSPARIIYHRLSSASLGQGWSYCNAVRGTRFFGMSPIR